MKINKLFIAGSVVAASMSLSSCVGDLDLLPTNPTDITASTFTEDPEKYMREVFADIYLNISTFGPNGNNVLSSMDGGMSTFQRAVFTLEEVPSDEACWLPASDKIPWTFQFGEITSSDPVVLGAYSRMQLISSLCNQFIQTDFQLQTPEQEALREEFVRQAKILRSGMYFYLISNYGNVPLNDENITMGSVAPQLSTNFNEGRRLVTEAVVNTLEDVVSWYKANDPNNNPPYGYVGLDVAESLLVKFYLNYEIFTGTPAWDKCFDHAQAVIARKSTGGFVAKDGTTTGLAKNYFQNFSYNNTDQNEIIWRIVSQNSVIPSPSNQDPGNVGDLNWANGGLMLMGYAGDNCMSILNTRKIWACMVARTQFVEVFDWDATYNYSPDDRVTWWFTEKDGYNIENPNMNFDDFGNNGYLPIKFTNWWINDDGSVSASHAITDGVELPVDVVYEALSPEVYDSDNGPAIDYGMIRLAEIYLSAAEAALHGGGSTDVALKYVNYIRERAGLDDVLTINLVDLQNERQKELYSECTRRTDLVRYGKWVSGYNWNWKYHAPEGRDFPSYFNIYPIPQTPLTTNGYVQNPGY